MKKIRNNPLTAKESAKIAAYMRHQVVRAKTKPDYLRERIEARVEGMEKIMAKYGTLTPAQLNKIWRNPGATWHENEYNSAQKDIRKYGIEGDTRNQDMALGRGSAHYKSYMISKERGMTNPTRKRRKSKSNFKFSLPIIAIVGGLVWLLFRNRTL